MAIVFEKAFAQACLAAIEQGQIVLDHRLEWRESDLRLLACCLA